MRVKTSTTGGTTVTLSKTEADLIVRSHRQPLSPDDRARLNLLLDQMATVGPPQKPAPRRPRSTNPPMSPRRAPKE